MSGVEQEVGTMDHALRPVPMSEMYHEARRSMPPMPHLPRWLARAAVATLAVFGTGATSTVIDSEPAAADVGYTTPGIDDETIVCWMDMGSSTDYRGLAAEIESVHDGLPYRRSSAKLIDAVANNMATANVSLEPGSAKCGWTGKDSPKYWTPSDEQEPRRESNAETAGRMTGNAVENAQALGKTIGKVVGTVGPPVVDAATKDDCSDWHFWEGCRPTPKYSISFENKATGIWLTCSVTHGDSEDYVGIGEEMNEDHARITGYSSRELVDKIAADLLARNGLYDPESAKCVSIG